jgi:NAD(P)-dependent dehydrogenase (short-subunit alcohol dehydrogenase family)
LSGVAWVTGAGRGLGRAVALALAQRGLKIGMLGRPSPGHAETAAAISRAGSEVVQAHADFGDAESLTATASALIHELGVPDVVVHNAGLVVRASVEETSIEDWDRQLDVNLRAPFVLTRFLLKPMRERRRGRSIFVGSISGTIGSPGAAAYAASKWGLTGFVKSLAAELSDSGLMACAVLPGSIDTEMLKGSSFQARMSPEDVAKTVEFLALDAPLAHNGAVIEMFGV